LFKIIPPLQIKLKLTKTRHLVCQSRINGVKAVLLIDTGASSSCIAHSEKETFNIRSFGLAKVVVGRGSDPRGP